VSEVLKKILTRELEVNWPGIKWRAEMTENELAMHMFNELKKAKGLIDDLWEGYEEWFSDHDADAYRVPADHWYRIDQYRKDFFL